MLVLEYYFVEHSVKLVSSFHNTVTVVAVHHEDQPLGVLEVMPPQWTNLDE